MAKTYPHIADGTDSRQSIYESSSVQHHPLGTRGWIDGRVFFYAKSSGAAVTKAKLCRTPASEAEHMSLSAESTADFATQVSVTLGTVSAAANLYAGGVFFVIDSTGSGQERVIKSHTSGSASAAGVVITLEEPLEDGLGAGSEVTLRKNLYADVVVTPGNALVRVAGAPQTDIPTASTTAQYFWLQTWGSGMAERDNSGAGGAGHLWTYATATTDDAGQLTLIQSASSTSLPASFYREPVAVQLDAGDNSDADGMWVQFRIAP